MTHSPSLAPSLALLQTPSRKAEDWRWTNLAPMQDALTHAAQASPVQAPFSPADLASYQTLRDPVARFVIIDGVLRDDLSHSGPWQQVALKPDFLDGFYGATPLVPPALNGPAVRLCLSLPAGQDGGTVEIIHIAHTGPSHMIVAVDLGAGARCVWRETHVGHATGWTNGVADFRLAEAAHMQRVVRHTGPGAHSETSMIGVGRGAHYHGFGLMTGAQSARCATTACLTGERAFVALDGIQVAHGPLVHDVVNRIQHDAPHGTSSQTWRLAAAERGQASVSSCVGVARGAQKTDSRQSLKAVLLDESASVNAKPELEIFADDVQCAHGAAIGALDETAAFYLASRGIPADQARQILLQAFLADALGALEDDAALHALYAADALGALLPGAAVQEGAEAGA